MLETVDDGHTVHRWEGKVHIAVGEEQQEGMDVQCAVQQEWQNDEVER